MFPSARMSDAGQPTASHVGEWSIRRLAGAVFGDAHKRPDRSRWSVGFVVASNWNFSLRSSSGCLFWLLWRRAQHRGGLPFADWSAQLHVINAARKTFDSLKFVLSVHFRLLSKSLWFTCQVTVSDPVPSESNFWHSGHSVIEISLNRWLIYSSTLSWNSKGSLEVKWMDVDRLTESFISDTWMMMTDDRDATFYCQKTAERHEITNLFDLRRACPTCRFKLEATGRPFWMDSGGHIDVHLPHPVDGNHLHGTEIADPPL